MLPYLVYYSFTFSIFLIPPKYKALAFSILWFIFVGLRNGIGVDYFSTLQTIERQVIDFDNIANSFTGYNFFDAEIIYKLIATFFSILEIKSIFINSFIAAIESIFLFLLIRTSKSKNLFILIIVLMFSLHYPMNAIRQGFCLIALIFANNYFDRKSSSSAIIFYLFTLISHYASIPIILISRLKISFKILLVFNIFLIALVKYLDLDTLMSRYSIDQIDQFTFKGNGLKLYLFTFLFILFNIYVNDKKLLNPENILIFILFTLTLLFNPVFRLYFFYLYYKLISTCYKLNFPPMSALKKITLLLIPFLLFLFEWQEILRFKPCLNCGDWLPYKSLLF